MGATRRHSGEIQSCASDAAVGAVGAARCADVACIEPPAERFMGKNAWWAYLLAVAGAAVPVALAVAVGLPIPLALAVAALLSLRTALPLARNWVDLYPDRFTVAFGLRTATVLVARVAEVGEVRRALGAATANAPACVRVALHGRTVQGGADALGDVGPTPLVELFVALRDNARFVGELEERRRRLRHFGSEDEDGLDA